MSALILAGIELPPPLPKGRPKPEDVEPWLAVVETLMGRGVATPYAMKKALGVSYRTAKNWMDAVRERWANGLTDERMNWRRESLYAEADEIARAAWVNALAAETPTEKAGLFKVVLMANQRKAALTGLDRVEVKIDAKIDQTNVINVVQRVEADFGLAPGALEAIGKQAAQLLSTTPGGGDVVDAEVIDQGEELTFQKNDNEDGEGMT